MKSFLCALIMLLLGGSASAFIDPPVIEPAAPTAGSLISTRIRTGHCDVFVSGDTEVITQGNRITLRAPGFSTEDLAQCIFGINTFRFVLGRFLAGNYTLEVFQRDVFTSQLRLVGTTSFVVAPAIVETIPVNQGPGLALLMGAFLLIGMLVLRRRA